MATVRPAAVAGTFYPGTTGELDASVQYYLSRAEAPGGPVPKAIIAPHAGYIYSGPVAATAYARIAPARETINRVVLLGPCHRVPVRGLAASGADSFATPLGQVPVDKKAIERILVLPQVQVFDATHGQEHSLEVHLPFLQVVLEKFTLVPLVVGEASAEQVAEVIDLLWGGPETLLVVSSDLSHYHGYDEARRLDAATCQAVEALDASRIGRDQACGRTPMGGLLTLARRNGMTVSTVDLRNSGDTAGPRDKVVGYGSWIFFETHSEKARKTGSDGDTFAERTKTLLEVHGATLLGVAAASIEHGLDHGSPLPVDPADYVPELTDNGACFVTLYRKGRLRGCIGSTLAHRKLVVDAAENGYAAAFKDPRFARLTEGDLDGLELTISLLSKPVAMTFADEADLLSQLRVGTDGLIIEAKGRRALFLPSVWESLRVGEVFLKRLKVKAGLKADHWSDDFKGWRFVTEEMSAAKLDDPAGLWSRSAAD